MKAERLARYIAAAFGLGLPLGLALAAWLSPRGGTVELRARVAERGGWSPAELAAEVGRPLRLRLTSDDVVHGFGLGQSDLPAVDILPGEVTEITLTFDQPGRYTFYCTRWCGPGHWRMRGVIEVTGPGPTPTPAAEPEYVRLGLDLEAPHPAAVVPDTRPNATLSTLPPPETLAPYLQPEFYRRHSPAQAWQALRADPALAAWPDAALWDVVAWLWRANTSSDDLAVGQRLYAQNCAACHGESGAGDGVMVPWLEELRSDHVPSAGRPTDFTDVGSMLGASPALLQGKVIRGGMGTGMPYFGPILTESQTWAVVAFLWTFVMEYGP